MLAALLVVAMGVFCLAAMIGVVTKDKPKSYDFCSSGHRGHVVTEAGGKRFFECDKCTFRAAV